MEVIYCDDTNLAGAIDFIDLDIILGLFLL